MTRSASGLRAYGAFLSDNAPFLSAGTLLTFTSSYGQTFFISLFAAQIMATFGLTDGEWGLVYTGATTASALAMIWAGAMTDRIRVRALSALACLTLAAACLGMATATGLAGLVVTVVLLRFAGQGMMSHLAAVAMARWFVATRGRALSISAMGFALGQAALPVLFVAALDVLSWRILWVIAAGVVLATIPVLAILLRGERTPQSVARDLPAPGLDGRHWMRGDVLRHWLFWAMIPLLLGPPAFGTALFFHQVHLTEVKGWDLAAYVALLPALTAVSVAVTFGSGAILDRIGAGRLMQVYLLPFAAAFIVLGLADGLGGAALGLMIFGIGAGAQATVPSAFWAEFYGTRHLGSIKALAAAIMVFGSAVGPGLTGLLIDAGFAFPSQMWPIAMYFLLAGAIAALAVGRVRPRLGAVG